jgi:predicted Rossmann fold nucleotide-binding protein DprA/Smf involved in DNA uptake
MNRRVEHQGNAKLLSLPKTAFLCSRRIPASSILKCYDWAIAQRKAGRCVISGFHSQIEKDVLHYLLGGDQPIIVALARGLKTRLEPVFAEPLSKNRLLIITSFSSRVTHASEDTANMRNELIIELADEVFVPYAQPGGNVERIAMRTLKKGKNVQTFNLPENRALIEAGAAAM